MGLVVSTSFFRTLERVVGFGIIVSEEGLVEGVVGVRVLFVVFGGDAESADEEFDDEPPYDEVNKEVFALGILTKLGGALTPGR